MCATRGGRCTGRPMGGNDVTGRSMRNPEGFEGATPAWCRRGMRRRRWAGDPPDAGGGARHGGCGALRRRESEIRHRCGGARRADKEQKSCNKEAKCQYRDVIFVILHCYLKNLIVYTSSASLRQRICGRWFYRPFRPGGRANTAWRMSGWSRTLSGPRVIPPSPVVGDARRRRRQPRRQRLRSPASTPVLSASAVYR